MAGCQIGQWFPRTRGDRPKSFQKALRFWWVPPHLRGVGRTSGRTFEFTFALPEPSNAGGRPPSKAKPAGKPPRKNFTSTPPRKGTPKAEPTKRRTELEARVETKQGDPLEEERKRTTSPEQKERARKNAQEKRRQAKEFGLCRDCSSPAIPGKNPL